MPLNLENVAACICETAELDIMPRYRALAAHEIVEKKPGDIVTVADREAEERLNRMLLGITPGALIVGEEMTHDDPSLLRRLDSDEPLWIIDPVDGTANFAAGEPLFAVMLAYVVHGETQAGWIYDPVAKIMAMAEKGNGAQCDGEFVSVPDEADPVKLRGRINFGSFDEMRRPGLRQCFRDRFEIEKSLRCAGHEFLSLIRGQSDFRLYNRLWAWDHAPGVLILREAGGHVGRVDNEPYRAAERTRALLCAGSLAMWSNLSAMMEKIESA